jgi:hypothetical protein
MLHRMIRMLELHEQGVTARQTGFPILLGAMQYEDRDILIAVMHSWAHLIS